jgi:hypothetical protein
MTLRDTICVKDVHAVDRTQCVDHVGMVSFPPRQIGFGGKLMFAFIIRSSAKHSAALAADVMKIRNPLCRSSIRNLNSDFADMGLAKKSSQRLQKFGPVRLADKVQHHIKNITWQRTVAA